MSKEMKARLRKEYVGFGGAENSVRATAQERLLVVAALVCRGAPLRRLPSALTCMYNNRKPFGS
jgi:hypothetical protein